MILKPMTIWLTGLPCSGKTTIAKALKIRLLNEGVGIEHLDGDELRGELCSDLGFSKEDRDTNIKRVIYLAKLLNRNKVPVITSFISPFRAIRAEARSQIENFVEIYTDCPKSICAERDSKGMYAKAYAGQIDGFTGVNAPYEAPMGPDLILGTDYMTIDDCVDLIIEYLISEEFITTTKGGYSLFIGRYQPPHAGHEKLIRTALDQGRKVCIGIRTLPEPNKKNPYSYRERWARFDEIFEEEIISGQVTIVNLPDITEVCYGRGVGWGIRQITLPEEVEAISATKIREGEGK